MVLVVGAGLMVRTILNLSSVDAGFNSRAADHVRRSICPTPTTARPPTAPRFYHRLVGGAAVAARRAERHGDVGLPPLRRVDANDTDLENFTSPKEGPFENVDYYQTVGADYFETMGIPIVDGRAFTGTDEGGAPVAIVNETFVRTFFPDRSPLGQRLRVGFSDRNPWLTIVGVAKDVKQGGVDQKTGTELYFYGPQAIANTRLFAPLQMNLVLRSDRPAAVAGQRRGGRGPRRRCVAADGRAEEHGRGVRRLDPPAAAASPSSSGRSPAWRCCSPPSAPTGCSPTWSPSDGARSGSGWRSAPTSAR